MRIACLSCIGHDAPRSVLRDRKPPPRTNRNDIRMLVPSWLGRPARRTKQHALPFRDARSAIAKRTAGRSVPEGSRTQLRPRARRARQDRRGPFESTPAAACVRSWTANKQSILTPVCLTTLPDDTRCLHMLPRRRRMIPGACCKPLQQTWGGESPDSACPGRRRLPKKEKRCARATAGSAAGGTPRPIRHFRAWPRCRARGRRRAPPRRSCRRCARAGAHRRGRTIPAYDRTVGPAR